MIHVQYTLNVSGIPEELKGRIETLETQLNDLLIDGEDGKLIFMFDKGQEDIISLWCKVNNIEILERYEVII